jgi:hypothetical protein
MGHVQCSVFKKAGIERAISIARTGLQSILVRSLLGLEKCVNTISRRRFLVELYKNHDIHNIIPLVIAALRRIHPSPTWYPPPRM